MFKNLRFRVFENPDSACAQVASELAGLIRERAALGRTAVLGLACGKNSIPFYDELIYLHREEGLSFNNVITFSLNEYCGIRSSHPASFRSFMKRKFFDHVDLPSANIHFLSGRVSDNRIPEHCADYEQKISDVGGIDFQILALALGLGRNGQLGLNEPGTAIDSRTRRVKIDKTTRRDAAPAFGGIKNVPLQALTMGCGTILEARKIALLAWGLQQSSVVRDSLEFPITPEVSASFLQTHATTQFFLDVSSASLLTRQ